MTSAPPLLQQARSLLLAHLDIHPGKTVSDDLDPAEVGIVGDAAHIGGYHCGKDRLFYRDGVLRDYSVIESPRDKAGLSIYASALDIGWFKVVTPRGTFTLRDFNRWLVGLCKAGDPDTLDIREVIYSLDGITVLRWDRLGKRTSGDTSHRTHTHISEYRDARGRRMVRLMTRWLQHIGLLATSTGEDDDMTPDQAAKLNAVYQALFNGGKSCGTPVGAGYGFRPSAADNSVVEQLAELRGELAQAKDTVMALAAAHVGTDPEHLLALIRKEHERAAGLERAERAVERGQLVAEVVAALPDGAEVSAEAIVDLLAARLAG